MTTLSPARLPAWAHTALRLLAIAVVFGIAGYGVGWLLAERFPDAGALPDFRWADLAAGGLALVLVVAAVSTLIASLSPVRLGRLLKLEGPAGAREISDARLQALVFGLSGVIMAMPMAIAALGVSPLAGLLAVGVLLAIHTALNLKAWRGGDELIRRVVTDSASVTFWLGQGLLFVWAAAERLGAAPVLTAWDAYVVLMGLYLTVSMVMTIRRGLA